MATFLYYENKQILSGQPTPLVSRQDSMVRYGERWTDQTTITLNGQITGCITDYDSLILNQQRLIDIFSKDYQEFQIIDSGNISNNGLIYSKPYCIIRNGVQFEQSNYAGLVNYSVSLECYEENLFSGFYGVLEPRDSWSYEEQDDRRLVITRSMGARGFNTNDLVSNALLNAKSFVQSRTGSSISTYPSFIEFPSGITPCLKQVKETINRMVGSYGLELRYEADLYYNLPGILRYTTNYQCDGLDGVAKMSIDGKYEACLGEDLEGIRNRYKSFDIFNAANEDYLRISPLNDLNSGYLSSGVVEDIYKKTISFNVEFDNFTGQNTYLDYKVSINSGDNDITVVDFDGTISARGDSKTRWERVKGFYETGLDAFALSNMEYQNFAGFDYPLNSEPLSSGVTFNRFTSQISTNVSWNNKEVPISGFSDLEYSIGYTPALQKVVAKPLVTNLYGPICEESYKTTDLGWKNRCIFSINGNGIVKCGYEINQAIINLKSYANSLFHSGCPQSRVLLEQNDISTGTNSINFTFTWSADSQKNVVTPKSVYNLINNLEL